MKRKRKKFSWPRKLYDKSRISEENKLVTKYGLKNKREIWKAEAKIKYFRTRAKSLITADPEEQKKFFDKLNKIGLKVENVADVLALNKEDLLKRRLPSMLVEKKKANTPKQARQMVVHKRVVVKDRIVNVPSYLVGVNEEDVVDVRKRVKKTKVKEEQLGPAENTKTEEETEVKVKDTKQVEMMEAANA